jgi:predicted ABC-type ATPase
MTEWLDRRPLIVAIAGSNGAGKSTFYNTYLRRAGLPFVNADLLAAGLAVDNYRAAAIAESIRQEMVQRRESFVFETVFSDPGGDKLRLLEGASAEGYTAVLIFIGISSPESSEQRVSMRVAKGGHDVPDDKLRERFPRTVANLAGALHMLPMVIVYDNDDLLNPYRKVAVFANRVAQEVHKPLPAWFRKAAKGLL